MTTYFVVNMTTRETIACATRREARDLADRLSIETPHLWFLMIKTA